MNKFVSIVLPVSLAWLVVVGALVVESLRSQAIDRARFQYALRVVAEEIGRADSVECRPQLIARLRLRWTESVTCREDFPIFLDYLDRASRDESLPGE